MCAIVLCVVLLYNNICSPSDDLLIFLIRVQNTWYGPASIEFKQ
jgi:hypothetical protein